MKGLRYYWDEVKDANSPARFLACQLLLKLRISSWFTLDCDGYRIRFTPSGIAIDRFMRPSGRRDEDLLLPSLLRPGYVVIDVGANIGSFALRAASLVGPTGAVHAVEAHPRTFHWLEDNLELNHASAICAYHLALGAARGKVAFSDMREDDLNHVLPEGGVEVDVDTLDHQFAAVHQIDLLKIDVEGFELFVLQGGRECLRRTRAVYVETFDVNFKRFGYDTTAVTALLREAGFAVHLPTPSGLVELPTDHRSIRCENLIALRDEGAQKPR